MTANCQNHTGGSDELPFDMTWTNRYVIEEIVNVHIKSSGTCDLRSYFTIYSR